MSSAEYNGPRLHLRRIKRRFASAAALILVLYLAITCFEIALVPTASMERTILVGDHLLVSKVLDAPQLPFTSLRLPRIHHPKRGEIISFHPPTDDNLVFLKRVVAVEGDSVEIRDGAVFVNGRAEPASYDAPCRTTKSFRSRVVPPGYVFVLGDNRDNSEDSRFWGPVRVDAIVGTPVLVAWSVEGNTSDWLNSSGSVRREFYFRAAEHFVALTRWSRLGHLVQHG